MIGDDEMTKIFAHRGSKGTHPENTLSAFREACRVKADGIELDIQLTKDHHLVVIHDETVDRTTNGQGLIKELTLADIKKLDAGSWYNEKSKGATVPTFLEVLELLNQEAFKGVLNIEVKTDRFRYKGIEELVVKELGEVSFPGSYMYSSFNTKTLERLHAIDPETEQAAILDRSPKTLRFSQKRAYIDGFHPSLFWIKKNQEELSKYKGSIRPWTINKEEDIALCVELELEGIHTDFPERAMRIREEYQK